MSPRRRAPRETRVDPYPEDTEVRPRAEELLTVRTRYAYHRVRAHMHTDADAVQRWMNRMRHVGETEGHR